MTPTSPKTYRVLKVILMNESFTQLSIHKSSGVSLGHINSITHWLLSRRFIERVTGKYRVIDPAGIIAVFPLFRHMDDLVIAKLPVRGGNEELINNLPRESVLCLDSALSNYSSYIRTNRVCVYTKQSEALIDKFKPYGGGVTMLHIYKPDLQLEDDVVAGKKKYTSKLRTVIDLACDGKIYMAKDLFKDLWGLELG